MIGCLQEEPHDEEASASEARCRHLLLEFIGLLSLKGEDVVHTDLPYRASVDPALLQRGEELRPVNAHVFAESSLPRQRVMTRTFIQPRDRDLGLF